MPSRRTPHRRVMACYAHQLEVGSSICQKHLLKLCPSGRVAEGIFLKRCREYHHWCSYQSWMTLFYIHGLCYLWDPCQTKFSVQVLELINRLFMTRSTIFQLPLAILKFHITPLARDPNLPKL